MNNNDDLLAFLAEGLNEQQRDLVTRSFYTFAQGDPDSAPVCEAVLLAACSRRLSLSPKELRAVLVDFAKLLVAAKDLGDRVQVQVEKSNAEVVASFKEEADRATSGLRATAQHSELIVNEGRQVAATMQKSHVENEALLAELRAIKGALKAHADSGQNGKAVCHAAKEIISTLKDVVCVNWMTIGIMLGIIFAFGVRQLPEAIQAGLFVVAVVSLRFWAKHSWCDVLAHAKPLTGGSRQGERRID